MKKRESFKQLTEHDRDRIHALYGNGHNQKDVARVLGVDPSTISRELARYGKKTWRYSATEAQKDAERKRANSKRPGMKIADDIILQKYIISELKKLRSPDEIAGRMKVEGMEPRVGKNAIYKWLYSEDGKPYCKYLCTKRAKKKKQKREKRKEIIPDRISLVFRPNIDTGIHTERDLFVSPIKLHSRPCGLIIAVRNSRLLCGSILPNREGLTVTRATTSHFKNIRPDTCTTDNGSENTRHKETGVPTYFCDPGAPWQKPLVESSIGLLRRWFIPKGTNLAKVTNEDYQTMLHVMNGKYRKSNGYKSAYEISLEDGIIKRIPKKSLLKAIAFR
jgi:IS30 family transposase